MTLKWKLAGLFFVLSLLPVAVAGYMLLDEIEQSFERGFETRVGNAERGVQARMNRVGGEVARSLGRIANDPLITRGLIEPLMRGRFYSARNEEGDDGYERALVRDARRLMNAAVLDTLRVLDLEKKGQVLALGHRMGFEDKNPQLVELVELGQGGVFFSHERVDDDEGGTRSVWTLQVAHVIEAKGVRVALIGGRILDTRFAEDLRTVAGDDTEVALDEPGGRRVAATFSGEVPPEAVGGFTVGERPIINPGEKATEPVALLKVFVPRSEVVHRTRELWALGGIMLAIIAGSAIVLALAIARRISKPLEGLAFAASAVAAGKREHMTRVLSGRDEVARLTQAFDQMTRDLVLSEERLRQSERVAAWREIARRIAHEIKNPLSPIQISIETLRKAKDRGHKDFDELFTELTATVLEEVQRMKRIVSEFSDFARMPAPRPQEVELQELVAQVVLLMRESAPNGVRVDLSKGVPEVVSADPDQIRQSVLNLVKNAIEAVDSDPGRLAKGGGRVLVSLTRESEGVLLVVEDDGPGMSTETRQRIFTPYFTTKTSGKVVGTGLGLPIVQRIVEEHGGTIHVESTPTVGTRFEVRLPRSMGRVAPS